MVLLNAFWSRESYDGKAYHPFESEEPKYIFDYPTEVWQNAQSLKDIFVSKKDDNAYLALGEKILLSPKDYEKIGKICILKKKYNLALEMIDRGLKAEKKRQWHNQSSYSLESLKRDVLGKMGRTEEALKIAWGDFKSYPSEFSYRPHGLC